MVKYILNRIIKTLPMLIVIIFFSFFIIHIMPGDPVRTMLGDKATQEQVLEMQKSLNLDKPLLEQFKIWILGAINLDFGTSILWKQDVLQLILKRIKPTFSLAFLSLFISLIFGVPLGIKAAKQHGKFFDKVFSLLTLSSISLPMFWVAIILIDLLCVKVHIFPVSGYHTVEEVGFINAIRDLLLPSLIMGFAYMGQIARMTRATMMDVLGQDYLRTARAKGLSEKKVINIHAFINALSPIVMIIGFSLASLLGGTVVIEQIFNIPGLGNLMIVSILGRDYPLIQGVLLLVAIIFILVNLLVDIVCALIDPKVRCE